MQRRQKYLAGFVAFLLGAGLFVFYYFFLRPLHPRTSSDLIGTYIADYKIAWDEVTLRSDGTYLQDVTIKGTSKTTSSKGKWTYDPASGYVRFEGGFMLVFKGPNEFNPDFANVRPGAVVEPAEFWFGRLWIGDFWGDWPAYKKVKKSWKKEGV